MITVGLSGLTFESENKGCGALAYSFMQMILKASSQEIRFIIFGKIKSKQEYLIINDRMIYVKFVEYHLSWINKRTSLIKEIKKCEYIFDFTEGDSFTDIYGMGRLFSNANLKYLFVKYSGGMILGPQTYGPFNTRLGQKIGIYFLRKCFLIFSRDEYSTLYVKKISGREAMTITDVAFSLPYEKKCDSTSDKIKVGLNISGLLWNNGYNGDNKFGLTVNYKQYIEGLIEKLIRKEYEIHLIPHVICKDYNNLDNDVKAIDEVANKFSVCIKADNFENPIQAKSYISNMDIFIGARMHSTIAAFSSGIITIPFSYSRKFEGLYDTLQYPYCINGRKLTTNNAIEKTLEYITSRKLLKERMQYSLNIVEERLRKFEVELTSILEGKNSNY